MSSDYYEVFGVAPDADIETIKQRYRVLVRENHPDVSASEDAHARMQIILEAWSVLSQPSARKRYDLSRRVASESSDTAPSRRAPTQSRSTTRSDDAATRPRSGPVRPRVDVNPRTSNPRTRLLTMVFEAAQLYNNEGRDEEAISLCNKVIKSDPRSSEAADLLGDIYAKQGRNDLALLMYKRAMQNQPNLMLYRQKWEALQQKITSAGADNHAAGSAAAATVSPPPAREPESGPASSAASTPPVSSAPRAAGCGATILLGVASTGVSLAWWLCAC
jgi:curved DNA-binding protein CbpA